MITTVAEVVLWIVLAGVIGWVLERIGRLIMALSKRFPESKQ